MPNPFDVSYLTESSTTFGPFAWVFYFAQVLCIAAGVYFSFFDKSGSALRQKLTTQLGLALLAVGSIGTLLGVLRLRDVSIFSQRFWFWGLLLVDLALAAYVVYYARVVYPRQLAAEPAPRTSKRQTLPHHPPAAEHSANGDDGGDYAQSRSRRDARRGRKRKQR